MGEDLMALIIIAVMESDKWFRKKNILTVTHPVQYHEPLAPNSMYPL